MWGKWAILPAEQEQPAFTPSDQRKTIEERGGKPGNRKERGTPGEEEKPPIFSPFCKPDGLLLPLLVGTGLGKPYNKKKTKCEGLRI